MSLDFIVYFLIISLVSINGIVKFKVLTIPFKILTVIIFLTLISEIISRILVHKIRNSNPPYHVLCIIQYIGFSLIYYYLFNQSIKKRFSISLIIPFITISILNSVFFQPILTFPSYILMLSFIIFIIFSLMLFLEMLESPKETTIGRQSIFWFNCAMFVYSTSVPICFGMLSHFIKHNLNTDLLNGFLYYITLLYYFTLGISIWLDKEKS